MYGGGQLNQQWRGRDRIESYSYPKFLEELGTVIIKEIFMSSIVLTLRRAIAHQGPKIACRSSDIWISLSQTRAPESSLPVLQGPRLKCIPSNAILWRLPRALGS